MPVDDPSTMFVEETATLTGVSTETTIYSKLRVEEYYSAGAPGTSAIREPDVLSILDEDYCSILGFDTIEEMSDSMVAEYKAMSDSVKKYNGFYIGRYELTGNVNNPTEKAGTVLAEPNWYYLYKACQNVINNNTDVKSTMIYGCQWDETCSWLEKNGYDIIDSSEWENYDSSKKATGSDPTYKANEIYDMAGNCWERTQEANSSHYRVERGGCYRNSGSINSASARYVESDPDINGSYETSRATLYIS